MSHHRQNTDFTFEWEEKVVTKALFGCLLDGQSSSRKASGCPILSAHICACVSVFTGCPCVYMYAEASGPSQVSSIPQEPPPLFTQTRSLIGLGLSG